MHTRWWRIDSQQQGSSSNSRLWLIIEIRNHSQLRVLARVQSVPVWQTNTIPNCFVDDCWAKKESVWFSQRSSFHHVQLIRSCRVWQDSSINNHPVPVQKFCIHRRTMVRIRNEDTRRNVDQVIKKSGWHTRAFSFLLSEANPKLASYM